MNLCEATHSSIGIDLMPEFHLTSNSFVVNDWGGGTTSELFIYPPDASYKNRDFSFRLSVATIEESPSTFTKLSGVLRTTLILEGDIELIIDGQGTILNQFDQCSYDGGARITSTGHCKDFNLMCREGYEGKISIVSKSRISHTNQDEIVMLYVLSGVLSYRGKMIEKGDLILMNSDHVEITENDQAILIEIKKPR